jgi:hypothetical protein
VAPRGAHTSAIPGFPLIPVSKVPVGNIDNYRVGVHNLRIFSKLSSRSEIAIIHVVTARHFPLDNHFIHLILPGKF